VQVCRHGVTSSDALSFRTWIGRSAKTPRSDHRLERRSASGGQRVLDDLSGAGVSNSGGLEPKVSNAMSLKMRSWFNAAIFL